MVTSPPAHAIRSSLVRRALRLSVLDGLFYAVMVGASESYLGALAVELGHGPTDLALLGTVPLLAGAVSQLAGPSLAAALGNRKRLVVAGALVQALSQLGFFLIASHHDTRLWPLLAVKVLYWISGAIIAPAWSTWMATLTEGLRRERYFALRSGAVQVALVISFGSAGAFLQHGQGAGHVLEAFRALFVVAVVARLSSAWFLAAQPDLETREASPWALPPPGARLKLALTSSNWRIALYLAVLMFGAQLGIPFYTPYLLRVLRFDYTTFTGLTLLSLLTKALTFPLCHRLSARFGLRPLVAVAGVGVAVLPMMWALTPFVAGLAAAQIVSGIAWAGMEYATFQLLLTSARPECRLEFLSLANSLGGMTQVLGALVGGELVLATSYEHAFMLSALGRGAALVMLVLSVRHLALPAQLPKLFMRLLTVRPSGGSFRRPILTDPPPPEAPGRPSQPPVA